jgi:hypothetical protein
MGHLFRSYWIPGTARFRALRTTSAGARGILSEKLLAFRRQFGRLGLVNEFCAHVASPLWFGRNEENEAALPVPRLEIRRHGSA